jgi:hypothetical protein
MAPPAPSDHPTLGATDSTAHQIVRESLANAEIAEAAEIDD